jgi:hypothetical protein
VQADERRGIARRPPDAEGVRPEDERRPALPADTSAEWQRGIERRLPDAEGVRPEDEQWATSRFAS